MVKVKAKTGYLPLLLFFVFLLCLPCVHADIFDNIGFGSSIEIEETPNTDCPHAMLIAPINNSINQDINPVLTIYLYDDDDTIWELNVTWYNANNDSIIDKLTTGSDREASTIWRNLNYSQDYTWYVLVENSSGGNITSNTWIFKTKIGNVIGGSIDFYGVMILLAITLVLVVLAEGTRNLLWYFMSSIVGIIGALYIGTNTTIQFGSDPTHFDSLMAILFIAIFCIQIIRTGMKAKYGE